MTVLTEEFYGPGQAHVLAGHAARPHDAVAVLADPYREMLDAAVLVTMAFPTGVLLDSKGKVLFIGSVPDTLQRAQDRL